MKDRNTFQQKVKQTFVCHLSLWSCVLVKVLLCCTWWQWFGWWWQVFPWCRCWPVISAVTGDNNLIIVSPLILCSAELQFLHWQNISNCCQWHKTLSVTHRFNVLLLDLYLLSLLHSVLWICSDFLKIICTLLLLHFHWWSVHKKAMMRTLKTIINFISLLIKNMLNITLNLASN